MLLRMNFGSSGARAAQWRWRRCQAQTIMMVVPYPGAPLSPGRSASGERAHPAAAGAPSRSYYGARGPVRLMWTRQLLSQGNEKRRPASTCSSSSLFPSGLGFIPRLLLSDSRRRVRGGGRASAPVCTGGSARRHLSFSFAGPRHLRDVLRVELLDDGKASAADISDLWLRHHEQKENVVGICLKGEEGTKILDRASQCPFYVQPVFRDDGFFMLISQFQAPRYFLLAYLEDYKMDPTGATPLMTVSVFMDYAGPPRNLALVRADVLSPGLDGGEARKAAASVLESYSDEGEYGSVRAFNRSPDEFDVDDYVSRMNGRWNQR